ncbi:MAG TPA: STAS domain-containing protein [Gaiellales bacterium]|nr:STAS domain-containing protein [Gaiellales bacterium]
MALSSRNPLFHAVPAEHARAVRLIGEIDLSTVDDLRAMLDALSEDGHAVALDLAEVTFMDSSGMHAFEAYAQTLNGSRPLVLENAPAHVHRLFELTGGDKNPNIELRSGDRRG